MQVLLTKSQEGGEMYCLRNVSVSGPMLPNGSAGAGEAQWMGVSNRDARSERDSSRQTPQNSC